MSDLDPTTTDCPVCGMKIGGTDVVIEAGDRMMHADCAESPHLEVPRRAGRWAAFGARGQMAMGEVQRDTPR